MKKYFTLILLSLLLFTSVIYSQWYVQYQSTGVIYDVRFYNRNTGWACGGGMILNTTNGGVNWSVQNFGATFNQIHPVNDRVIYACGNYVIYKTTDGGENWFVIREGVNQAPRLYGLWFNDENTGWFCGDRVAMRTTNGGVTFIDSMFMTNTCNDIHFKNSETGNIAANSTMFRTTNSGQSWYPVELPSLFVTPFTEKLTFIGDTGWVVTRGSLVYRTTNYGINWDTISRVPVGLSETMNCVEFADRLTGYAGGYNGKIYKSTNGGFNWFLSVQLGVGPYSSIYAYNDSIVWASGGPGGNYIIHTDNGGLTIVSNFTTNISDSFSLYQNFPNPFNPSTSIKFDLRKKSRINLSIYNSLGKLIKELLNKTLNPGSYFYDFDATGLSSGLYFYQLDTDEFKEIKRMMFIK